MSVVDLGGCFFKLLFVLVLLEQTQNCYIQRVVVVKFFSAISIFLQLFLGLFKRRGGWQFYLPRFEYKEMGRQGKAGQAVTTASTTTLIISLSNQQLLCLFLQQNQKT